MHSRRTKARLHGSSLIASKSGTVCANRLDSRVTCVSAARAGKCFDRAARWESIFPLISLFFLFLFLFARRSRIEDPLVIDRGRSINIRGCAIKVANEATSASAFECVTYYAYTRQYNLYNLCEDAACRGRAGYPNWTSTHATRIISTKRASRIRDIWLSKYTDWLTAHVIYSELAELR